MNNQCKAIAIAVITAVSSGLITSTPAQAQNYNYNPYTGAASWLTLARSFAYPLNRASGGYAPFYLANNLLYGATYAANQGLFGRKRDLYYGQYADQEPYGDPRQRTRPYLSSQNVGDQMVHAKWKTPQSGDQQQSADDDQFGDVPVVRHDPTQSWIGDPVVTPQAVPNGGPVTGGAPELGRPVTESDFMPPVAPAMVTPRTSEPLAAGFVHVVNERFNGDIAQALRDKDISKYARAVGLVDSGKAATDKMSGEKVDLIRAILADKNESASVKINAVRVLLKH